jgi:general secretion pathway protein L
MMLNQKIRSLWSTVTTEVMAGAGSLGAFWDRQHLTLVHIQKGFAAPQVSHAARWPLPEEGPEGLASQIAETLSAWGVQGGPVSLAVSSQLGFMRQVTLPLAARENLAKVVGYEIDRFLPLGADRLVFDYQVARQTETEITLALMALPREFIEGWLRLCADTGLKPISVELASTAAANAFALLAARLPYSWLLLRVGEADFDLIHIQSNVLRHWHSGRMTSADQLMADLPSEIKQLSGETEPGALCIYGTGASQFRTSTLMEQFSFPVIRESQVTVKGLELETGNAAHFLPALGAAMRGVGKAPVKTNLLPESDRAVVKLTGLFLTRVLLILLLSLGVVWIGSIFLHKKISLVRVENQLSQLRPAVQQVEKKLTEAQGLGKQLQDIQKKVEQYPSTLVILKELTQIIPEHTYLYSLRFRKGHIELGGKSASAADLISILEKSGYFTKTEFVSPIVTDDTGSEIFKIKAEIKGVGRSS